jgi:hypothetical protein
VLEYSARSELHPATAGLKMLDENDYELQAVTTHQS